MTDPVRTPHCTKIRYGISGAPTLDESEMDGSHAPGVGVKPALIELVYHAPKDGKPASVSASVTGTWTRFGQPDPDGFGDQVETHFRNGPDGWPTWLAEEARLHDPDAPVLPSASESTPSRRAGLHDELVNALGQIRHILPVAHRRAQAGQVLALLYREWPWLRAEAEEAVPPEDRAAVLREAIDVAREEGHRLEAEAGIESARGARSVAYLLRKILVQAQPEPSRLAVEAELPLSPDYQHPDCGFHWHGRDGMDIPMRDGQPVCPRCELAKLSTPADALLPAWEAMYEPGNVSDYLIGYANDEAAAKGAAEAWLRSQQDEVGRLEWTPWGTVTAMPDGYDAWFELTEHHDDAILTGPGIVVRRRMAAEARGNDKQDDEGDELVCVDECGNCDACGMEPFGTPAEGWREAARFLRRTARESGDRAAALHGARLIEEELRRQAEARDPLAFEGRPDAYVYDPEAEASRTTVRAAEPADTQTPCGPAPDQCDAEAGEPCADHEREQVHAEGEHCFCGPECAAAEAQQDGAQSHG